MRLIESSDNQCLYASFVMAMDVQTSDIAPHLHHHGTENILPELGVPNRLRGYHPQEMVDAAWKLGFACIHVDRYPESLHGGCVWKDWLRMDQCRFGNWLTRGDGVLCGLTDNGIGHACAWNSYMQLVYDPRGFLYDYSQCEERGFDPKHFFLLTRISHV